MENFDFSEMQKKVFYEISLYEKLKPIDIDFPCCLLTDEEKKQFDNVFEKHHRIRNFRLISTKPEKIQ